MPFGIYANEFRCPTFSAGCGIETFWPPGQCCYIHSSSRKVKHPENFYLHQNNKCFCGRFLQMIRIYDSLFFLIFFGFCSSSWLHCRRTGTDIVELNRRWLTDKTLVFFIVYEKSNLSALWASTRLGLAVPLERPLFFFFFLLLFIKWWYGKAILFPAICLDELINVRVKYHAVFIVRPYRG